MDVDGDSINIFVDRTEGSARPGDNDGGGDTDGNDRGGGKQVLGNRIQNRMPWSVA